LPDGAKESWVGFLLGVFCSVVLKDSLSTDAKLKATEPPFRLMIALFCGMFIEPTLWAFVFAFFLSSIGLVYLHLRQRKLSGNSLTIRNSTWSEGWQFLSLVLALALGLHLSSTSGGLLGQIAPPATQFFLNLAVFGYAFTDGLHFILAMISDRKRSSEANRESAWN
jgi:hypothetical protein